MVLTSSLAELIENQMLQYCKIVLYINGRAFTHTHTHIYIYIYILYRHLRLL